MNEPAQLPPLPEETLDPQDPTLSLGASSGPSPMAGPQSAGRHIVRACKDCHGRVYPGQDRTPVMPSSQPTMCPPCRHTDRVAIGRRVTSGVAYHRRKAPSTPSSRGRAVPVVEGVLSRASVIRDMVRRGPEALPLESEWDEELWS